MTPGTAGFLLSLVLEDRISAYCLLKSTGQMLAVEGLGDDVAETFPLNFGDSHALGITGDDDYSDLVIDCHEAAESFDAPQTWHGDVEDDRVDALAEALVYG